MMNRKYTGVVFDFNGTLFWDTPLHNKAWNIFLKEHNLYLSDDDFFRVIHGKTNKDILKELFGEDISDAKVVAYTGEKEALYRQLCLKTEIRLAPGVESFLDCLRDKNVPFTIATASGKENLNFYFEHLPLKKWFDLDKVVYDDGTMRGKPHPDLYEKAMKLIGIQPEEVTVFEDANMGLLAAKNAGAGNIIVVNSNDDDYSDWAAYQIITNYNQVDCALFQ
ncbi:HAD family phosphatase [Dysgonomonas sp. 25]|uniref:HAD family hydrolase n=1 Tax=Dysgonomonas sp. 25 TaxID=2302933 RepID=UPI0021042356|nr:HAD family phosphatase [Dysgonomonas sp. 25]